MHFDSLLKMIQELKSNSAFLNLLHSSHAKQRKALLKTMTQNQLKVLIEVIYNIFKGTLRLSKYYIKKLFPHRTTIRSIASRRVNRKRKRDIFVKKHSIIPILIKPVLSLLLNGAGNDTPSEGEIRSDDEESDSENGQE